MVATLPTGVLTPELARPSADTVLTTNLNMFSFIFPWSSLITDNRLLTKWRHLKWSAIYHEITSNSAWATLQCCLQICTALLKFSTVHFVKCLKYIRQNILSLSKEMKKTKRNTMPNSLQRGGYHSVRPVLVVFVIRGPLFLRRINWNFNLDK